MGEKHNCLNYYLKRLFLNISPIKKVLTVKLGINIISYIHKYILVEYLFAECINKNVNCNINDKEAGKKQSLF